MSGNVWEWCSDRYGKYGSNAQTNPAGPAAGSMRVYRGSSWGGGDEYCRVSYRFYGRPDIRNEYLGFRLACNSK
jgi:formylglycine-generating enzyme required for sulfatase activity